MSELLKIAGLVTAAGLILYTIFAFSLQIIPKPTKQINEYQCINGVVYKSHKSYYELTDAKCISK